MDALRDFESYWKSVCTAVGGEIVENGSLLLKAPQGGPPVHGIFRTHDLGREIKLWQQQGTPFSVLATNTDLAAVAEEHGLVANQSLVLIEGNVHDLGAPKFAIVENVVDDFVYVQMIAHQIPTNVKSQLIQGWRNQLATGQMHMFVAWDKGPAGCAALYTGNGNAGLYAFGVLPSHQRRGVGTALMQACMRRALSLGLTKAVASTTPDGRALAESIGMTGSLEAQQFVWMPK